MIIVRSLGGATWGLLFFYGASVYNLGDFFALLQLNVVFAAILGAVFLSE